MTAFILGLFVLASCGRPSLEQAQPASAPVAYAPQPLPACSVSLDCNNSLLQCVAGSCISKGWGNYE